MDCDYADPDDILIDCIIDGVCDRKVQERLLDREEALTLPKAVEICQQFETSRKQVQIVRGQEEDTTVTEIHAFKPKTKLSKNNTTEVSHETKYTNTQNCLRCGNDRQHARTRGKCPAHGTSCSYCKKPNHWAKVSHARKPFSVSHRVSQSRMKKKSWLFTLPQRHKIHQKTSGFKRSQPVEKGLNSRLTREQGVTLSP